MKATPRVHFMHLYLSVYIKDKARNLVCMTKCSECRLWTCSYSSATVVMTAARQLLPPFLLAGQSNMADCSGVSGDCWDGNVPPECQPNQNILRLSAPLRREETMEPLHADISVNKINGVGPSMAFANAVLALAAESMSEVVLGLVPCAAGGTIISQWERWGWLYENLLKKAVAEGGRRWRAAEYEKKMVRELTWDLKLSHLPIIQVGFFH